MAPTKHREINAVGIRVGDTVLVADDPHEVTAVGLDRDDGGIFVHVQFDSFDLNYELTERVTLVSRKGKNQESPAERMGRLEQAVREAIPHVYRQQHHGKHEQDRLDAIEWLEEYKGLCAGS